MRQIRNLSQLIVERLHEIMLAVEIILLAIFFAEPLKFIVAAVLGKRDISWPAIEVDKLLHALMLLLLLVLLVMTTFMVISESVDRRRVNSILQLNRHHGVTIVLSSIPFSANTAEFKDYFLSTTPIDGVEGIKLLVPLLQRIGIGPEKITFKFSSRADIADLSMTNVFIIGGHQNNRVAKQLNYDLPVHPNRPPQKIRLADNKIHMRDGRIIETEFVEGLPHEDFGLVTRGPNRFSIRPGGGTPCVMWSFEGVRHWGTLSGIDLLAAIAQPGGFKELATHCPDLTRRKLAADEFVQFIARCKVDNQYDLNVDNKIFFPRQSHSHPRPVHSPALNFVKFESAEKVDWVCRPSASELNAYSEALSGLASIDWKECQISSDELAKMRSATNKLMATAPALAHLRDRVMSPSIGFAVWDMSEAAEAEDEEWHRRLLVLLASTLGEPFGAFKKHGFWKSIGVNVAIEPSKVEGIGLIPLHQDFVNAQLPPDLVLFRALQSDPQGGGASIISNIGRGLARLSSEDRICLRENLMREGAYFDLHGLGGERNPFPILEIRGNIQNIRFTAKGLDQLENSRLKESMVQLNALMMKYASRHHLFAGQTLFINQHIVCHGRDPLGAPVVSGADARYLEQAFVRLSTSPWGTTQPHEIGHA
jgi:hypothetical protein